MMLGFDEKERPPRPLWGPWALLFFVLSFGYLVALSYFAQTPFFVIAIPPLSASEIPAFIEKVLIGNVPLFLAFALAMVFRLTNGTVSRGITIIALAGALCSTAFFLTIALWIADCSSHLGIWATCQ